MNIENLIFKFCVGVGVGGHPPAIISYESKDARENSTSFDNDVVTGGERRKMILAKMIPEFSLIMVNFALVLRLTSRRAPFSHIKKHRDPSIAPLLQLK